MILTLDGLLTQRSQDTPERTLYQFLDDAAQAVDSLNYQSLLDQARALAHRLTQINPQRGPVILAAGTGSEHPVGLFACFLAGLTAIPVYPPQGPMAAALTQAILGIAKASAAPVILASSTVAAALMPTLQAQLGVQAPVWQNLTVPGDTIAANTATADTPLPGSQPDQPAVLLFTSGSTGQPKGVVLTHRGLISNIHSLALACERGSQDVVCGWLPHTHIAGLFLRLFPLIEGCLGVLMPPQAFMANPFNWLSAMSRYRCSITAAPDFAYALSAQVCAQMQAAQAPALASLDLSSLTMAVSGGEVVRTQTMASFSQVLGRHGFQHASFHPYYGLTETMCTAVPQKQTIIELPVSRTGLIEHQLRAPTDAQDQLIVVGNGSPLGETEVIAVNTAQCTRLPDAQIGEIWVRGVAVTPGYVGAAIAPDSWQGRLADEGDQARPFFRTGDLGFIQQGQVFITGRLKELVIVRGKNHYPLDIEATVLQRTRSLGTVQAAAFAIRDAQDQEALALAVEVSDIQAAPATQRAQTDLIRAVREAVAQAHGLSIERLFLMPAATLPRTPTQKIVRLSCAKLVQTGAWSDWAVQRETPAATGSATPIGTRPAALQGLTGLALESVVLGQLISLLAAQDGLQLQGSDLDRPIADLGLSSIQRASLSLALRQALGVLIPVSRLFDATTPRQLAQLATRLLEGGPQTEQGLSHWQDDVTRLLRQLPATLPASPIPAPAARHVLLTGATGFLGAWLLHSLLTRSDAHVTCHVRADNPDHAWQRLQRALQDGPGWSDDFQPRLHVVTGALQAPHWGLAPSAFEALADQVDTIVHNAADVNFVATYDALRGSNVDPLGPLLSLATSGQRVRPLHFVSTLAVFNGPNLPAQGRLHDEHMPNQPEGLHSGYAQSKWVAEAVLRAAAQRGVPVCIHRPGLVVGDTQTGRSHTEDFVCRFIKGCIQLGRMPDAHITLNLAGVDQVARGIAAAVTRPQSAATLNWTSEHALNLREVRELLTQEGHALQAQSLADWLRQARQGLPIDNALFPVQDFVLLPQPQTGLTLLELLQGVPADVDTRSSHAYASDTGLADADNAPALVRTMVRWMARIAYLA